MKRLDLSDLSFLVVDDNSYMRKILRALLNGYGVRRIAEAENARIALEYLRTSECDMVLCDWEMPGESGIELLKQIRGSADKKIRFMPVIVVSGYSEKSRVGIARDAGVNDYLVKPVSAATLYNHITNVILKDRDYIDTGTYFGPDRRWRNDPTYEGSERRADQSKTDNDGDIA